MKILLSLYRRLKGRLTKKSTYPLQACRANVECYRVHAPVSRLPNGLKTSIW